MVLCTTACDVACVAQPWRRVEADFTSQLCHFLVWWSGGVFLCWSWSPPVEKWESVTPAARVNEKEVLSVISACLCQANSSGVPEPLDFPSRNPCPRPRHLTLVRLISGPGLFSVAAVQSVCCGMFRESLFSTHEMPFACQPQLSQPNISRHSQMSPKEENNPLQIAF